MNWPESSKLLSATCKRFLWNVIVTLVLTHLTETTSPTAKSGWDWTSSSNSIDILNELTPVRKNLIGVQVIQGPYSLSPALNFTGDDRNIRLPDTSYAKVMTLLQSHHDITFVATIRQEPNNVGTLFSLSKGFTSFLELQSSGRKDEIRLHYTHQGKARMETFMHRLADGYWHRMAVSVSGGVASLYVDCKQIERRLMTAIPDTAVPESAHKKDQDDGKLSLWIGQRAHNFLFKGSMGDVKLVAGSNGHLVNCPAAETECPTCGEFHSLRSVVARLEKTLQQLSSKLEHAEERLTQLEQCDCPRSCSANGTVYADGTSWRSDCQVCSCHKGQTTCSPVQCPDTPCRNPVQLPGECCRTCLRQCYFHGLTYDHGDRVSPRHCLDCQCFNGSMQCRSLNPELHCPALSCPPHEQFTVAGECCKQCPGVDYCASASHVCHAHAQCINLQTTYACHCSPGYTGDGKQCFDIDECETEGGPEGHRCGANTVCVNTGGSYRCDCLPGFVHPSPADNETCVEYDECATGANQCHPTLATCINTPGGYQCQCLPGYEGDGTNCEPICDRACQNGGRCVAPNQCCCRKGFQGNQCELDIDECQTGHQCPANSECRNMPGWYACVCKPGFRSPPHETLFGTLCQDIDECAEGSHSCPGHTQCLNTIGSYECRCPPSNPNCSLVCKTSEGVHQSGQTWISSESPCVSCQCREGVVTCSKLPCHCSASSTDAKSGVAGNHTIVHHPNSEQCCPQCRSSSSSKSECPHPEIAGLSFSNGQRWISQCQSCECLHGEIDCWQMECPPIYCSHPVRTEGDCCPRCPDNDPCSAVVEEVSSLNEANTGCHYQGTNYTQGTEWAAGLDGCTHCKCKNGKVLCQFNTDCAQHRLVVSKFETHRRHPGLSRTRRASRGVVADDDDDDPERVRMGSKKSSTKTDSTTRNDTPRTTTSHWRRMARAARSVRSSSADHSHLKLPADQSTRSNSSPSSASGDSGSSHQVPVEVGIANVDSHQESGPT